ncbi:UDP-N-acetylmuramoyl-tripeptide--D-alanyl-D-alanine ligase [Fibrobacterota bacterium]
MNYMELTIGELADLLKTSVHGPVPKKIASRKVSLCTDSRSIKKNQVFWALAGDKFDGHAYVDKSFAEGCLAAVVNRSWCRTKDRRKQYLIPVPDTSKALLHLARAYAAKFTLPVISLTGSNGKTTTKDMLNGILSERGKVLSTRGNFNNHIGVPLTLFELDRSHRFAIIEMGTNHPGEIGVLAETVKADMGIITNIGYSHIEFFGSLQGVLREKKTITRGFHDQSVLIINGDDRLLAGLKPSRRYKVLTFGIKKGEIQARDVALDARGYASFKVDRTSYSLKVPGMHNVYNALAAIAVGTQLKIPKNVMAKALGRFKASSQRMEVMNIGGLRVYNDCYNANPSSMEAALEILGRAGGKGKSVAVLGDMGELGPGAAKLHRRIGKKLAASNIDDLYTLGTLSREIGIAARSRGMPSSRIRSYTKLNTLNKNLIKRVKPGDKLLIKGSRSMKMEKITNYLAEAHHA